jgi:flagellar motor switch protein FliN/FliY
MAQKARKNRDAAGDGPAPRPAAKAAPETPDAAMAQAQRAVDAIRSAADAPPGGLELPDFAEGARGQPQDAAALSLLRDVNLQVKVELGRTRMYVEDVLRLNENSIIELDKLAGDPVDIYVNERPVARGEVLVVNDNFCVRVSEIIRPIGDD